MWISCCNCNNLLKNTRKNVDKLGLSVDKVLLFLFADTDTILFGFGPKIYFGEYGLEVEDKESELAAIGGENWEKYNLPDDVEYGFVIVKPGEGDMATA